jgi:hypothetical protein
MGETAVLMTVSPGKLDSRPGNVPLPGINQAPTFYQLRSPTQNDFQTAQSRFWGSSSGYVQVMISLPI